MNKSKPGPTCAPRDIAETTCEGKMTKAPDSNSHLSDDQQGTERKDHIRRWIDGKLRRWTGRGIAGGLGSTLMALPALSQATVEELYAFQFAETITGVRSVKLLKNGDVELHMADGRTLIVAAENVQILDSGAIMIAEEAVAEIAQFSVAEAGGAAAGGIGGAGAALGGVGLAGAAAAAGGGGSDGDDSGPVETPAPPPAPAPTFPSLNLAELQSTALNSTSTESTAPDGTTTVQVTIGSLVKTVTPDSDGNWSISLTPSEASGLPQGVTTVTIKNFDSSGEEISVQLVQFDIDTIPPTISISGFSDGAVLNSAEQSTDLAITGTTDAENGQTVSVTLNGQTYTGTVSAGQWSVTVPSSDLTALPDGATVVVTADVSDSAGNPAVQINSSFDTDFSAPIATLDQVAGGSIDLVDLGGDLSLTGTTTAEDGQVVTVTFDGQAYTGTAAGGSWSVTVPNADLSGLVTGVPASITVAVEDTAGNPSAPISVSVPVNLTGPSIAIAPLSVGAILNSTEIGSDLTVTGTTGNVGDGQQVTVTLDGQTYTGTVSGGTWSVTIPSGDLVALADGGSFNLTADVSDSDGLAAHQADVSISTDVTAPTLSIDSLSDGAIMSAAEQGTDLTIAGSTTAEDGQVVSIEMNGQSYSATVSGGSWSVSVPAADLAALPDATTVTVTANVTDTAGNPALQASNGFDTDFTSPTIAITNLSDGAVMNAVEQGSNLTVSGTSDAPDGTIVTVEITRDDGTVDITGTATVTGGAWTYTATASDLSGLQDAEDYDVNASVADTAGNNSQATDSFATDFTAPSVTIDPLSVGSVLDLTEQGSDLSISGTTTAEDGQTVSVTLGGQTYTAVATGGAWSTTVPTADLAALSDATNVPISASVDDAAGNSASAATTSITTDFRPILSMSSVGTNNAFSLSDAQSAGIDISGSSIGLTAGQTVDVMINGSLVGAAVVALDGSWSLNVPPSSFSGFDAGDDLTFAAQATVSGGPDPLAVSSEATAHVPAAYVVTEVDQTGTTVTFAIHADADRDVSSGLAMTAELEFDSSVVTFDAGSDTENGEFDLFLANPGVGDTVNFAGAATTFTDLSQPLVTFTMTVQDPSQPIILTITTPDGGPTNFQIGTDGNDTLTATGVDTVIRGGDGDDTIDVSDAGRDIVVFEANPADNGTDTVTGFTIGPATDVTDALMFSGLNVSSLRGNGADFETLTVGNALGSDTGFVGLTTILTDLTEGTIEAAVESFTGALSGDELYLLATDGTDSVLVKVDYSASDTATVETVATFDGLGDLSGLSSDNILHTDPTGASA
ncbi:Ig-like domain-containing protein [Ruegeria sp. EL01]|uniref:beta strand repeat-containing protein n=1 Tax=Ruegeria sp. EL01 TaxID=2107578 RepID=UPI0020B142B6|nr:Ig-like domain-containing protein [Ruegeria sp. EL01]